MLGYFSGVAIQFGVLDLGAHFFQHRVAQHFYQTLAPVFDIFLEEQILLLEICLVARNGFGQFLRSFAFAGNGFHDGRSPAVVARSQRLHGADFALHSFCAITVAFVVDEDVGDLHYSGFDGLDVIAHAWNENNDGDSGETDDIDLILPDANRFDHDQVAAGGIEDSGYVGGGAGESAE